MYITLYAYINMDIWNLLSVMVNFIWQDEQNSQLFVEISV